MSAFFKNTTCFTNSYYTNTRLVQENSIPFRQSLDFILPRITIRSSFSICKHVLMVFGVTSIVSIYDVITLPCYILERVISNCKRRYFQQYFITICLIDTIDPGPYIKIKAPPILYSLAGFVIQTICHYDENLASIESILINTDSKSISMSFF